ncbi:putative reverse transcriptase domain-containing protein [Tanacetum coccineum]
MSMLEERSSYINVSESAKDMDVGLGGRASKGTEDPSWSTSIKTRSHKCHLQHWKHFGSPYYVVIVLDWNIICLRYGERGFLTGGSNDKNKKGRSKEKGTAMVIDEPVANDDGDTKNARKTCPNSASDGVVPISTPSPGNSNSYANVTGKSNRKSVNFHTFFTPRGNEIDVVVPVEFIRAISKRFVNTAYGFLLGKWVACPVVANYGLNAMLEIGPWFIPNNPLILKKWHSYVNLLKEDVGSVPVWVKLHGVPVTAFSEDGLSAISTKLGTPLMLDSYTSNMFMQSWGKSSYARAMIKLRADVELKDKIVAAMPKITREGYYTCNIHVECTGKTKNLKKTSQTPKGVSVGQKMGFKPTKQVYQHVSQKPTANTSVNKKKNMEPTKEVSKSNPFEVLTSIENDVEFGTNGGTSNLASQAINSSGSSLWNVDANDEGKPLENVTSLCDYDSEDEVASVDNEMANFLAKKYGYGTQSLLEQWTESYENDDYGYDLHDDDMYEGQDFPDKLQAICDKLNITVRGRRKK